MNSGVGVLGADIARAMSAAVADNELRLSDISGSSLRSSCSFDRTDVEKIQGAGGKYQRGLMVPAAFGYWEIEAR